jgi:hypothetical protein
MSENIRPRHASRPLSRTPQVRLGAVLAVALAAGFVAWLLVRGDGNSSPSKANATAVSASQLQDLASSLGHPIFWVGPQSDNTYELTKTSSGKVFIRYLPSGVGVGADKQYLTVATYPFPGAYPAIRKQAGLKGAVTVKLAHRGVAVLDGKYPQSVHLAYPGVNYQVEVYDPTPQRAMQLVSSGQLAFFGSLKGGSTEGSATGPRPASVGDLKSLAKSLTHPIYWAGPKAGDTYELTQTSSGQVYVRYLPRGVKVGASADYLTVGTYPFAGAFAAIKQVAKGNAANTIKLPGGGLGVVDGQYPKSIHVAYPNVDFQIEVFDPSPARARQIVASHRVRAIG